MTQATDGKLSVSLVREMTVRCHYILTPQEASTLRVGFQMLFKHSSVFCESFFLVAFCSSGFRSFVE